MSGCQTPLASNFLCPVATPKLPLKQVVTKGDLACWQCCLLPAPKLMKKIIKKYYNFHLCHLSVVLVFEWDHKKNVCLLMGILR